ncbi:hypothetical protein [Streptomyces sp. NPDC006996]|uniref:hypothetical protein n=1 Tax=Streptomyces sp. NPDC006996 TaxID=3156908 RepID=UPI0033EB675C
MEFRPVRRAAGAFQQSLDPEEITSVCDRAFGSESRPLSAVELGMGMYTARTRSSWLARTGR